MIERMPPDLTSWKWPVLSSIQLRLLRFSGAVGLLLLIAINVDIDHIVAQLSQTQSGWIVVAVMLVQLQIMLSALRWRITASRLGHVMSLKHAIVEYYLATFANLTLPGGVAGDAARVYRNRHTSGLGTAAHGVVLERLAGQAALFVVTIVGWLLWPILMHASVSASGLWVLTIALLVFVLGVVLVFLIVKYAPDRITRFLTDFGPSVRRVWCADRQWIVQSFLSLSIVVTYLLVFLVSSYAIQQPLSAAAVIAIVPVVLLSMLIPLSIGGWGIREAAAATLWPLAGLSSESGVATSVVYALVSLIGCLPGLISFLLRYGLSMFSKR